MGNKNRPRSLLAFIIVLDSTFEPTLELLAKAPELVASIHWRRDQAKEIHKLIHANAAPRRCNDEPIILVSFLIELCNEAAMLVQDQGTILVFARGITLLKQNTDPPSEQQDLVHRQWQILALFPHRAKIF